MIGRAFHVRPSIPAIRLNGFRARGQPPRAGGGCFLSPGTHLHRVRIQYIAALRAYEGCSPSARAPFQFHPGGEGGFIPAPGRILMTLSRSVSAYKPRVDFVNLLRKPAAELSLANFVDVKGKGERACNAAKHSIEELIRRGLWIGMIRERNTFF